MSTVKRNGMIFKIVSVPNAVCNLARKKEDNGMPIRGNNQPVLRGLRKSESQERGQLSEERIRVLLGVMLER